MANRQEVQRQPVRYHTRGNSRWAARGFDNNPHSIWGDSEGWGTASKSAASNGSVYAAEPTVTAQDAPNAAKLTGLGYVAVPLTNWTTGQSITIGSFLFNWNGSAWAAGAHA